MRSTPAASQAYPEVQHRVGLNHTHALINSIGRGQQQRLGSRSFEGDKVDMATTSLLLKPNPIPLSSKLIQAGAALSNSSKLRSLPGGEAIVASLATATADTVFRHLELSTRNRHPKAVQRRPSNQK